MMIVFLSWIRYFFCIFISLLCRLKLVVLLLKVMIRRLDILGFFYEIGNVGIEVV